MSNPTEDQAIPFPGAPRFFKRLWTAYGDKLTIYGYSSRSEYSEDHEMEDESWERTRSFPSICFSVAEPDGEYGFSPFRMVQEITKEEFIQARQRGWTEPVPPDGYSVIDGSLRARFKDLHAND